jgi:hypothetical protein
MTHGVQLWYFGGTDTTDTNQGGDRLTDVDVWIQIEAWLLFESLCKVYRERVESTRLCAETFPTELKTESIVWFGNRKGGGQLQRMWLGIEE